MVEKQTQMYFASMDDQRYFEKHPEEKCDSKVWFEWPDDREDEPPTE